MVKSPSKFTPMFPGNTSLLSTSSAVVPVRPIIYPDQPYVPDLTPRTREEAIFFLARGGRNALSVPVHLIRAFCAVYGSREKIQKNGHFVNWQSDILDEWVEENTNILVERWRAAKPKFFTGLSKLGTWLQQTLQLMEYTDYLSLKCAQRQGYEPVIKMAHGKLRPSLLIELADDLDGISDSCNWAWTFTCYLRLVSQRATSIQKSGSREESNPELKERLTDDLKQLELYHAHIPEFLEMNPDEWVIDKEADTFINGIREALENPDISFASIVEQIRHKLNTVEGNAFAQAQPSCNDARQGNQSIDSMSEDSGSSSVPDAEDFLRSDKNFSREFFIWFCLAYVETQLASVEDPDVTPRRLTSWDIYMKMRELNKGEHISPVGTTSGESEKESKKKVTRLVSLCKKRFEKNGLPTPKKSALSNDEAAKYIDFYKKYREIAKYFPRTTFIQRFIDKDDTGTA